MTMNQQLIDFYLNNGKDHAGRTLKDILAFTDEELEETHDYIQWVFPTKTRSSYNNSAPILDDETITNLKTHNNFNHNLCSSIERMFKFWGITYKNSSQILSFDGVRFWMHKHNHNILRITRFMECARLFGKEDTAQSLFNALL